jgi:hypothetical protein
MRFDILLNQLLDSIAEERAQLRRTTRYVLPLLLLPIGFALAQLVRGWVGLITGAIGAMVLLAQIELFLRPTLERARVTHRDLTFYLGLPPSREPPNLTKVIALLLPAALALIASMALFLPTMLASASPWQRLLALALGLGALYVIWQRLAYAVTLLDGIEERLSAAQSNLLKTDERRKTKDESAIIRPSSFVLRRNRLTEHSSVNGLLDPILSQRAAGAPLPVLPLSPAAQALLRIEGYLLLRDFPGTEDRELREALAELARQAHHDELRHWLLPPVGGKIYLPVAANGAMARLLGATMRRLGLDGGYSATLGTWLVRLPPARSYAVAGRLIDALIALGLAPTGGMLVHHLTVQGDLGQASKLLSIVHLLATPLLFEERPGRAQGDERPFVMHGGGVLDDMAGRSRHYGPRTDFVDGFIFVEMPGMEAVEHRTAHTVNLRIKQILAFGLFATARPYDRRARVERSAAAAYERLVSETRSLLKNHGLEAMLEIAWLDGRWSELWPLIRRMSELKAHDQAFLDAAQHLRDAALEELETIATAATNESSQVR